jgi:FkbM family methyltransferase
MNSFDSYIHDVTRMRTLVSDHISFVRYAADRLLVMLLDRMWIPGRNKEREIRLCDKTVVRYRLNKGDMQSLRELWLEEAYTLPTDGPRKVLVDLGANIGLSSVWLKRHYSCEKILAIEPVRSNVCLVRKNFRANAIGGTVIEAAIGPSDGVVKFEESAASNAGRVGVNGYEVRMLCMSSLIRDLLPSEKIDLLKIDIEGGEAALFTQGDLSWLRHVKEIIVEFHPTIIDYPTLVSVLTKSGFEFVPAGTAHPGSMDYFRRR